MRTKTIDKREVIDIPTYEGNWLWGNMFDMPRNPIHFFDKVYAKLRVNTFYVRFPFGKIITTADPSLIKHVLQGNHKNYEKDRGYDELALLLGRGLVTSRGELWKKQRKIAQPTFYKKSLNELYKAMLIITDQYKGELAAKDGQEIDISREMMAVTAKIAMKALFSADMEGNLLDVYETISFSQEYVSSRAFSPLTIPFNYLNGRHKKFIKTRKVLYDLILGLIEERRQKGGEYHDFLQMLMDARYEDGESMPEELLRDELVTIFSAGHETSANGLAWALYLLSQHPEIIGKIREETSSILNGGLPAFDQLKELTYTKMVIEESMRLYPPVWAVGRYALEEDEWEGNPIRPKMPIAMHIYHLHRNPELWEDPEVFDPSRFEPEKVKTRSKYHYLPFAAGPRMCIGNHFAMMEMQLLLPMLIHHFDFELIPNQRIELDPMVTLRPKYGIKMKLRKRWI